MKPMVVRFLALVLFLASGSAAARSLPDLVPLIEENSPSVVKIEVEAVVDRGNRQFGPNGMPEIFRRFFEDRRPRGEQRTQSAGSGFVISEDGYILTNHHVVNGATTIVVRFVDQREFDAEIIGQDPRSDLALLKIDAQGLRAVEFAQTEPSVGEWVVAIGSPFGLDYSASAGIVSARGRSLPTETGDNYVPFIQTDVAINPGNSGGPLFNLEGEVVGINSQIFTRSGGYMGLSFAIPSSVAQQVVAQLREDGSVSRGWLGVAIVDVDRDLAEANGLERSRGALVTLVDQSGPAAEAGLRVGDIVLEFDGKEIVNSGDLPHAVGLAQAGETYDMLIMRELDTMTIEVELGELGSAGRGNKVGSIEVDTVNRLGTSVASVPEAKSQMLDIEGGVIVREVTEDSPAAQVGIRPGDVINLLNFEEIRDVEHFEEVVESLPTDRKVPIRFFRDRQPVFKAIKVTD